MDVIIAEKPAIAFIIASALGADKKEDGYVVGNDHIVTWCLGHLLELVQPAVYNEAYKKWTVGNLPIIPDMFRYGVKKEVVKQYKVLKAILGRSDIDTVVCATDAGREGELIFRNLYNYVKCKKPIKRIWVSSMEEAAFLEGYKNAKNGDQYDNLYSAALAREHCDWITGINLTRLFTVLYGAGNVLAVGRVMTPTLQLIYQRDFEIENFQKKIYYTVHIKCDDGIEAVSDKTYDKDIADKIAKVCEGQEAEVVEVKKETKKKTPPLLYDLTTLQRDCNRLYGFTANETLDIAQELYEKKLTTYPRTDSVYLTSDMNDKAFHIADKIKKIFNIVEITGFIPEKVDRLINDKKVTDHHAVIPTGNIEALEGLSTRSRLVFDLICIRLFCALSDDYTYTSLNARIMCSGYEFRVSGRSVIDLGFRKIQTAFFKATKAEQDEKEAARENNIPYITKGDILTAHSEVITGETKPPVRYTEDTLLEAMENAGKKEVNKDVERKGLGTSATRAGVIEKLVANGYVQRDKKKISVTEQGRYLLSVVPDEVKSVTLTCNWENELLQVANGDETYREFMNENLEYVKKIIEDHRGVEPRKPVKREAVCSCPVCGGEIVEGKFGLYCSRRCGLVLRLFGQALNADQCKTLFEDKKEVLFKGLKSSKGTSYSAYISYDGYELHKYTNKQGEEAEYYSIKCKFRFPSKKTKNNCRKKKTDE